MISHGQAASMAAGGGGSAFANAAIDTVEIKLKGWQRVCALEDIPKLGSRVVKSVHGNVAVFRNADDEVFALLDKCPHKGGPLSQGIVFGRKVACPLHGWNIGLDDGNAVAPDIGCAQKFETKIENGIVSVKL
jgi:nitrite reductase (NADH) small subunit